MIYFCFIQYELHGLLFFVFFKYLVNLFYYNIVSYFIILEQFAFCNIGFYLKFFLMNSMKHFNIVSSLCLIIVAASWQKILAGNLFSVRGILKKLIHYYWNSLYK
jgi:hypothetical protein